MSTNLLQPQPIVLRMAHAIASYIGFGEDETAAPVMAPIVEQPRYERPTPPKPRLSVVKTLPEEPQDSGLNRWRRHPQLREHRPSISEDVRAARHEAVRGLCAARAGAVDVAMKHFIIAAQSEQVDLTAVPGFWNLTRGQMQTAVDAYQHVGRYRDGAALDAHIATIFRPSLVGANILPIQPRENHGKVANT